MTTSPTVSGTVYTFTFDKTVFAVDAAKAGRIVTFSLAGKNILTAAKNSQDNNWGSTFWPSPQSAWNWPPPAELDPNPYAASLCGAALSMTSQTSAALGLAVTKQFSVDAAAGVVTIEYGLVNRGTQARSVAPWEITRVAAGGLTFFPMGDGSPTKGTQDLLNLQITDGVAWFAYNAASITNEQKVFADGSEGWIAHVDGNLLLVKAFSDTPAAQAAPGEAEIRALHRCRPFLHRGREPRRLRQLGPRRDVDLDRALVPAPTRLVGLRAARQRRSPWRRTRVGQGVDS